METDEHLRWEARRRPQAAIAAALGGLLPLAVVVISVLGSRHGPTLNVKGRLTPAKERPFDVKELLFQHHHAGTFLTTSILAGLGALAGAAALAYLFAMVRRRRPELRRGVLYALAVGAVLVAIASVLGQAVLLSKAATFAGGSHDPGQAYRIIHSSTVVVPGALNVVGYVLLGFSFVMVAVNAMRVGLLPRFMGFAGAFAGVILVLGQLSPALAQLLIIEVLWLIALATLFTGRWPRGMPPAWTTGRAEPWPSMAEQRERQARAREARHSGGRATAGNGTLSRAEQAVQRRLFGGRAPEEPAGVAAAPGAEPEARAPHPATSKRKRKRKRR